MGLDVIIVKDDLYTTAKIIDTIEIDDGTYSYFLKTAKEMNFLLLYTIDPYGDTIINHRQLDIFKRQIHEMRTITNVSQDILNIFQKAADSVNPKENHYIRFMGD